MRLIPLSAAQPPLVLPRPPSSLPTAAPVPETTWPAVPVAPLTTPPASCPVCVTTCPAEGLTWPTTTPSCPVAPWTVPLSCWPVCETAVPAPLVTSVTVPPRFGWELDPEVGGALVPDPPLPAEPPLPAPGWTGEGVEPPPALGAGLAALAFGTRPTLPPALGWRPPPAGANALASGPPSA